MVAAYEHYRSLGYTLEEADVIQKNARCIACRKSAIRSPAYSCTRPDRRTTYLHKTCSEYPMFVNFHQDHPLRLEEDVVVGEDAVCHACNTQIIPASPTYTCLARDVDTDCRNFYLHKSCAELPTQVNHHKHNAHPLFLQRRPDTCICDVCSGPAKTGYACKDCDFDVCVLCAFEERVLSHEGHKEHPLTLMKKKAFFECDACYEEAKDSSYVCTTCEFWIHKSCALSPSIIPNPTYHHHLLTLVYSIPQIHRFFKRICGICSKHVYPGHWLYYCHKCTYFVHMKCSTSTISLVNEIGEDDHIDNEPDLIQFPLQKLHPLQKLQYTLSDNGDDDDDDVRRVLICDGCIKPITVSHPSYYACLQCGFFLHAFCATKLPQDNHRLLYHCSESDHSFHYNCFGLLRNVKLGGTIDVQIGDKPHTLTLVVKKPTRKISTFTCSNCLTWWLSKVPLLLECDGCGYLLCPKCVRESGKECRTRSFLPEPSSFQKKRSSRK